MTNENLNNVSGRGNAVGLDLPTFVRFICFLALEKNLVAFFPTASSFLLCDCINVDKFTQRQLMSRIFFLDSSVTLCDCRYAYSG